MLESLGFHNIKMANNYNQAVKKMANFKPDLILSELYFSHGPDGAEIIRRIRENLNFDVVFVTSLPFMAKEPKIKKLKPLAVIGKPFQCDDLKHALEAKYL
jgi:response regulator of citrate/malate metabolism